MRGWTAWAVAAGLAAAAWGGVVGAAGPAGPAGALAEIARAEALIDVDRFDRALAVLKAVQVTNSAEAARLDLALGRIYLGLGKPAQALDFFDHAAMASLDDADATLGMAQSELALGHLAKARQHAEAALRADAGAMSAQLVLALVEERTARHDSAMARMTALARDNPDSEDVAVIRARFTYGWDNTLALSQLDQFVRTHPAAALAEDTLGRMLWGAGRREPGLDHCRNAETSYARQGNGARAEAVHAWIAMVSARRATPIIEPPAAPAPVPVQPAPVQPTQPVPARPEPGPVVPIKGTQPPSASPEPAAPVPGGPRHFAGPPQTPANVPFDEIHSSGSGLVLEGGGRVLTNRHVAAAMKKWMLLCNGLGQCIVGRPIEISKDADLALVELKEPFRDRPGMPLSKLSVARPGRQVLVMGYPTPEMVGVSEPTLTQGLVSKSTNAKDRPGEFQMTARINPGNSGGPVFDNRGNLVGISVSKLMGKVDDKGFIGIADTYQAVSAPAIAQFLKIQAGQGPPAGPVIDPEALYEEMLSRVVLIIVG